MIVDERVFDDSLVPEQDLVVHRNAELNELSRALKPLVDENSHGVTYLVGPSGTGKTMLGRLTVDKFRQEVGDVPIGFVNCWRTNSRREVTYEVVEQLAPGPSIHEESTSRSALLARLDETSDGPRAIFLDEADLADQRVLYDLYEVPNLALFIIVNRETEFFAGMRDRLRSRLQYGRRILVERYSTDELVSIIRKRAQHGLAANTIDSEHLELIARHAEGNARDAITILRTAAEATADDDSETIRTKHVDQAVENSGENIREATLSRLSAHQRAVFDVVDECGPIGPSEEIHRRYADAVVDPNGERSVRNYLRKLVEYGLVKEVDTEGRGRTYDTVDTSSGKYSGNQKTV